VFRCACLNLRSVPFFKGSKTAKMPLPGGCVLAEDLLQ
jgi:hypothetical protein